MNIEFLSEYAVMPSRGSEYSAGWDLYAATTEPLAIAPGEVKKISTDIAIEIPNGYFGGIYARSGMATKRGLRPANCVGVIDSDYRGPVIVAVHNDTDRIQYVEPKERIAQLIIQPYLPVDLVQVDSLSSTARGAGGFGSTGTK